MTTLRRRSLLLCGLAATFATVAPPVPMAPAAPVLAPGTAMATTSFEFGYSTNGGEWWTCGFGSHEEAKQAALEKLGPGDGAIVGRVVFRTLSHPDYANAIAEQFLNGGCTEMGETLIDALIGHNQENDFEGDFTATAERLGPDELNEPARHAIGAAMRRLGVAALAELVLLQGFGELEELGDELVEGLATDAALGAELEVLMRDWCERHQLEAQLRMLDHFEEEKIEVNEMAAGVAGGIRDGQEGGE